MVLCKLVPHTAIDMLYKLVSHTAVSWGWVNLCHILSCRVVRPVSHVSCCYVNLLHMLSCLRVNLCYIHTVLLLCKSFSNVLLWCLSLIILFLCLIHVFTTSLLVMYITIVGSSRSQRMITGMTWPLTSSLKWTLMAQWGRQRGVGSGTLVKLCVMGRWSFLLKLSSTNCGHQFLICLKLFFREVAECR